MPWAKSDERYWRHASVGTKIWVESEDDDPLHGVQEYLYTTYGYDKEPLSITVMSAQGPTEIPTHMAWKPVWVIEEQP